MFYLSCFSCNFDDQLSPNFHRFVILCWYTPSGKYWYLTITKGVHIPSLYHKMLFKLYYPSDKWRKGRTSPAKPRLLISNEESGHLNSSILQVKCLLYLDFTPRWFHDTSPSDVSLKTQEFIQKKSLECRFDISELGVKVTCNDFVLRRLVKKKND